MKLLLCIAILSAKICFAQTTIIVKNYPKNTKEAFISGNFNNWNPGEDRYKLKKEKEGYQITITLPKNAEFKFTQGNWESVEVNKDGSPKANRTFNPVNAKDTLYISIALWSGGKSAIRKSSAQKNVVIIKDFFMPQLNAHRKLRILLPLDYKRNVKRYPVIYMQDAQNLFDESSAGFGSEWGIDETLNKLQKNGGYGCIVVGIDNSAASRMNEYNPFYNSRYGPGLGNAYADFVALSLKPYIDSVYRTLPMRDFTAIGGSSLGGSISQFIALKYPDKFSKVLNFSPAYQISDCNYIFKKTEAKKYRLKMYMICGAIEGNDTMMQYDMKRMRDTLLNNGFKRNEIFDTIVKDGAHNEWFWNREFAGAYKWLFGEWNEIKGKNKFYEFYCLLNYHDSSSLLKINSYDTCTRYISNSLPHQYAFLHRAIFKNKDTTKVNSLVVITDRRKKLKFNAYFYDSQYVYYKFIKPRKGGRSTKRFNKFLTQPLRMNCF